MVFPFLAVTTSPGFVAVPLGMFSQRGIRTFKLIGSLSDAAEYKQPARRYMTYVKYLLYFNLLEWQKSADAYNLGIR